MGKLVKISPIKRDYNGQRFKTMESSLSGYGYVRVPGTKATITPKREPDGRYRTGVDINAAYIKAMSPEEQKVEIAFIKETLATLKDIYPDTDFGNRSKVWQAYSDEEVKVTPLSLSNSDVILNTDVPGDLLTYVWLRVYPSIAKSLDAYNRGACPDCQYYIANEEAEVRAEYNKKKVINKAIVEFESLTPTKRKQVGRLMGLPITDSSTEEFIYNRMDSKLKAPEFERGSEYEGKSTISVFNDILALADDTLYVKDLVEQSIRYNIYRIGEGGRVLEGTATVSNDKQDLVVHLLDSKNAKELAALEVRINAKK